MSSLRELAKQKIEDLKKIQEEEIIPEVVGAKITKPSKPKMKLKKIFGDKDLNKNQMIHWFKVYIEENQTSFTLDWLRGQKLTFESVNEMRK